MSSRGTSSPIVDCVCMLLLLLRPPADWPVCIRLLSPDRRMLSCVLRWASPVSRGESITSSAGMPLWPSLGLPGGSVESEESVAMCCIPPFCPWPYCCSSCSRAAELLHTHGCMRQACLGTHAKLMIPAHEPTCFMVSIPCKHCAKAPKGASHDPLAAPNIQDDALESDNHAIAFSI